MRAIDADAAIAYLENHKQVGKENGYILAADEDAIIKFLKEKCPTLTPPNEWVSVEERLPEENGEYIVTACDEGCPAGEGIWYDTVVVFAEYYDGCWTWNDGTEYDLTDIVTHWMPLPEPPDRRPPEGEDA